MGKALIHELGHSTSFGRLSLLGKVLWPMLLAASDDQGRGIADADRISWQVCPNVQELTLDNIPGILQEMAEQEMIVLYEDGRGRLLYQAVRWWEYQRMQWAQPSKLEAPEGWKDRVRANRRDNEYIIENWDSRGGFTTDETPDENPDASPEGNASGNPPGNTNKPNLTELNLTQTEKGIVPDPSALTVSEIRQLDLAESAWKMLLELEKAGKKRRTALKFMRTMLCKPPVAVQVYRSVVHLFPERVLWDDIGSAVGEEQDDLDFWHDVIKGGLANGWSKFNINWMLDHYNRREIPKSNGGKHGKSSHRTPTETVEIASGLGPPS